MAADRLMVELMVVAVEVAVAEVSGLTAIR